MPKIVCYSDTLDASAADVVAAVKEQGLEGVIAKRREACTKLAHAPARG